MINLKLFFSVLTGAFAILGLTKAVPTDITMPIMFICLLVTMFITAKEYKDKEQKIQSFIFVIGNIFVDSYWL